MDYGLNKTSSNYKLNQPFGGIATGDQSNNPAATPSYGIGQGSSPMPTSVKKSTPNASYTRTNPDGTTQTIQGYNNSSLPKQTMGSDTNDSSLTDSYTNALKSQQGATAAAQSLSGYTAPDPNEQKSALPGFDFSKMNPDQQKAFTSFLGGLFGMNQGQPGATPGLSQVAGIGQQPQAPVAPTTIAGDNSRFVNDPFQVNANALR